METIAGARPVRGRLAPTPSGRLHLGNARSFLLAWLWARSAGGRVVMRIEDVDRPRCRAELREAALADLAWLGLDWDEGPRAGDPLGPYDQSTRFPAYREALERLVASGRAYACVCSRRDVEEASRAPHGDEGPVYSGTCRGRFRDGAAARAASGREPTWRFRWEGPPVVFHDALAGETRVDPARHGDFVLWRRDELPGYQLAVVVDDAAQAVTQVLRGADLLSSTARQLALYAALGLRAPEEWGHVPFLRDAAGGRMAKRDASLALGTLRSEGVDPRRLVGALARTAGLLERDEAVAPADLVRRFAIGRIAARDAVWTASDHEALVSRSSPVLRRPGEGGIAMGAAENKDLVVTMFQELSRGNPQGYLDGLADDVKFTIIGKTKYSGLFDGKKDVVERLLGRLGAELEGGLTVTPEHVVGEGDTVVVQAQGRSQTKTGKRYDNTYCIVFRIVGGKVSTITEYLDTELVTEAFGR